MKVHLETMGCQMNRLDSELVVGILRDAGHDIVQDRDGAEVVLYNTCSVRSHAEQKVYSRLGADGRRKQSGKHLIVGVLGCMGQRLGEKLRQRYPQVDIICAPGQLFRIAEMIERASSGVSAVALDPARNRPADTDAAERMDALDLSRDPRGTTSSAQGYVRVMRGCDRFCTYCIVPFVRGAERSRDPAQILEEVKRLVDAGRTEITLLGQTVNRYRFQSGECTMRFSDLLDRLSGIDALRRLRFVTSHPVDFTDDILQAMRDLFNVCEYIHLPPQSGSDSVLERMNRGYTRAQYDELVDRARAMVPGVVLGGDFIVGFPGETEEDHAASADLIRRSGYKNSFIFKYSPRPGTSASERFTDDVPVEVKKRRNNELLAVQEQVGLAHHKAYVGEAVEVLVEGPSPRVHKQATQPTDESMQLVGRTHWDHIVVFDGSRGLIGQYVDVTITDATSLTLFGKTGH